MHGLSQKFTFSSVDLTACILVTDTKTAWAEGGSFSSHRDERRTHIPHLLPNAIFTLITSIQLTPIVLTSNQFARRWRMCNKLPISPLPDPDEEELWRDRHLTLLGLAHSLGGFQELAFGVAKPTLGVTSSVVWPDMTGSDTFI